MDRTASCPCGSGQTYAACCGRWHAGEPAPTAEALMRSRYSAFVLEMAGYLLTTWHASTRPASVAFEPGTTWLGLRVKCARGTGADTAAVEFVARYRLGGGSAVRLHERSRFVREEGRWYYVDG
ncbi:MAG: YchJ family protein [Panacagrimonas sp.]